MAERPSADKTPDIGVESSKLMSDGEKRPRIFHAALDLEAVPDNSIVRKEPADPRRGKPRHGVGVEVRKGPPVPVAPRENRQPAQSRLGSLESQHLEEFAVFVDGNPPLAIVIIAEKGGRLGPGATDHLVVGLAFLTRGAFFAAWVAVCRSTVRTVEERGFLTSCCWTVPSFAFAESTVMITDAAESGWVFKESPADRFFRES